MVTKIKKRALCILLTAAMLMASTDFTVLAEEIQNPLAEDNIEAGEKVSEDEVSTTETTTVPDESIEETPALEDEITGEITTAPDDSMADEAEFDNSEESSEELTETEETAYADTKDSLGQCGDNLTWKLENDTLTISGTGKMYDYAMDYNKNPDQSVTTAPWGNACKSTSGNITLCIENGVTSIGDCAFFGCKGLKGNLIIPDTVTTIGNDAFYICSGLSGELVIPDSVSSIGATAFMRCSGFTSLILSDRLTRIGDGVFESCNNIGGSLFIPDGVTSIGAYAFDICVINDIYLYETLSAIDGSAFNGVSPSNIVFHCIKDSYAYTWAINHGFTVKEWDGGNTELEDIYRNDITVNGKGYAFANFLLKNNKGKVQKNAYVMYSFDGINYLPHVTSDENGYVTIQSPLLENKSGKEELQRLETTDITFYYNYDDGTSREEKLKYNVIMDVTVTPLSFTQTWELGMEDTIKGSASGGVGVKAGVANVDIALVKAEIAGTSGGAISVEHTIENGVRSLTILQNYNTKIALNASVGPAAKAKVLGQELDIDIASVSEGVEAGASAGIGLQLDNYNPEDLEQIGEIGTFMLASQAQASGNPMLFALVELAEFGGLDFYNIEQTGTAISVEAGVGLGGVSFNDNAVGEVAAADAEMTITYDTTVNKDDNSKELAFGTELGLHAGLGNIEVPIGSLNEGIFSVSKAPKLEISAELDENNQVQSFAVKKEEKDSNGYILETGTVEAVEVSYDRDSVEQIGNNIGVVKDFVSGSTNYIFGDAQMNLFEELDTTPLKGTYSSTVAEQKSMDAEFDVGLEIGLGLEVGVGFSGFSSCEYETEGGTYESGKRSITNKNTIENDVKSNSYTIGELINEPLKTVTRSLRKFLNDVYGSVMDGIHTVGAYIQGISDDLQDTLGEFADCIVHIVSIDSGSTNTDALLQSYEITVYTMDKTVAQTTDVGTDVNEYKAYTVGNPYYVYVTDAEGNEIEDYSACPLKLTLEYTDEALTAAGLDKTQENNISIYMYSQDIYGFICMGGTVNTAEQTITVDITQPGQYMLAVDTAVPVVKNLKVSKDTTKPNFTVEFNKINGFKEFSLKLDGEEVIGTADWYKYYNKAYNRISYQVENELAYGKHTCSVYAVDSAGNAMPEPYEIEFYIENVLYTVTFELDNGKAPIKVKIVEGIPFTLPDNPTYQGYIFKGWYTEKNGQGIEFNADSEVTSNMTVYAYWEKVDLGDVPIEDLPSDGVIPNGIWAAGIDDYTYTGNTITPDLRLYDGNKRLNEKTNYTVSYKNNKNAYTYTDNDYNDFEATLLNTGKSITKGTFNPQKAPQIIVRMKGNYSGKRTVYFRIEPTDISENTFEADNLSVTYTGKKQTPSPKLIWNGKDLKYGTDFFIPEYDNAKKDNNAFKEPKTYSITLTGKNNFKGNLPITLTISESSKQIAMNKVTVKGIKPMPWTGNPIVQTDFTVKYKNTILSEANGEYTVSWRANTEVGTATLILTGTGLDKDGDGYSYIGTKKVSFNITGTPMSKVSVSGVDKSYTYTGAAIKPTAALTYKANKTAEAVSLTENKHYTVTYQKNEEKGTATIIYTGLKSGGYTGTKRQTFKIVSGAIDDPKYGENIKVTFKDTENIKDGIYIAPYMKGGAKPQIVVTNGNKTLDPDKDYKVNYINNKNIALSTAAKAPTVIITGKGNYKGSKSVKFTINKKPLSNENGITVVAKDKTESTNENGYRQNFKVYDADGKALGSKDYETSNVLYTLIQTENEDGITSTVNKVLDKNSIVPAGSIIRITVQGKGIYAGGEATGTYRILENNHDIGKATLQIKNQPYTGNPVLITDQSQFSSGKVFLKLGNGQKKELIIGTDIEVVPDSYVNNINKGTAKVTFRGINGFGGTKTVSFKIGTRSITEFWKGLFDYLKAK